jgi:hypothetical protein
VNGGEQAGRKHEAVEHPAFRGGEVALVVIDDAVEGKRGGWVKTGVIDEVRKKSLEGCGRGHALY